MASDSNIRLKNVHHSIDFSANKTPHLTDLDKDSFQCELNASSPKSRNLHNNLAHTGQSFYCNPKKRLT